MNGWPCPPSAMQPRRVILHDRRRWNETPFRERPNRPEQSADYGRAQAARPLILQDDAGALDATLAARTRDIRRYCH